MRLDVLLGDPRRAVSRGARSSVCFRQTSALLALSGPLRRGSIIGWEGKALAKGPAGEDPSCVVVVVFLVVVVVSWWSWWWACWWSSWLTGWSWLADVVVVVVPGLVVVVVVPDLGFVPSSVTFGRAGKTLSNTFVWMQLPVQRDSAHHFDRLARLTRHLHLGLTHEHVWVLDLLLGHGA